MIKLFKNTTYFSILYFIAFVLDTYVKVNLVAFPYRYLSKTVLILILLLFYIVNSKEQNKIKRRLVIVALLCFIIGDIFLIGGSETRIMFGIGALLFAIAKILYIIRFSNKQDFEILKMWPFLMLGFAYMCGVMLIVHHNLGIYFVPTLLYCFIVITLVQFAFLRKKEVNTESFWLVLVGVLLSMFSDTVTVLHQFYDSEILYSNYSIMFFYCWSQYFIVLGLLKENTKKGTIA